VLFENRLQAPQQSRSLASFLLRAEQRETRTFNEFGSKYLRLGLFVALVLVPGYEFFVAAFRGLSGVIGNFK
jgi:NADH:ubiquinone oxidoreductase subunit 2 (subunit N)